MTRFFWIAYRDKGYDLKTEKQMVCMENKSDVEIMNALIVGFNSKHPQTDRITGVEEVKADTIITRLEDVLIDWENGCMVFTADDAETVHYAIEMLKNIREG